jgi:transposase-like protein
MMSPNEIEQMRITAELSRDSRFYDPQRVAAPAPAPRRRSVPRRVPVVRYRAPAGRIERATIADRTRSSAELRREWDHLYRTAKTINRVARRHGVTAGIRKAWLEIHERSSAIEDALIARGE